MKKIFTSIVVVALLATGSCKKSEKGTEVVPPVIVDPEPNPADDKPVQVTETAYAFAGAEGGGKNTTGGRGGKIIKVTNLNDSGTGSLRAAVEASGARIIVFEVSGNIKLKSRLQIKNPNITIAGQTAPGEGICLQDYDVIVDADNVIIRFMRFRMGDLTKTESDALWGRYRSNIIIDHCSMSWSTDECVSFYANENFTLQWCILAESLRKSVHDKGTHGYGGIWGGVNASFHHNLLANHDSRNPRFDGGFRSGTGPSPKGKDKVDYRNNVIYNWGGNSAYGGENGEYNMVNNYYKPGPATASSKSKRIMQVSKEAGATYAPGYGTFYIAGNYVVGNTLVTADNWNGGVDFDSGITKAMAQKTTPWNAVSIPDHSAEQAYNAVLLYGGASLKRDAVDARIVLHTKNGTFSAPGSNGSINGLIDTQSDVGGWPTLAQTPAPLDTDGDGMPDDWETANKLDPKTANANAKDLSTGYDNIEVYLNSLVKTITDEQYK